jgi:Phytanoyl-CoA dioxygenase (PhyH)
LENLAMNVLVAAAPSIESADASVAALVHKLETDGVVRLPRLVADDVLSDMRHSFASRLRHMRWNNCEGYEQTERNRLMVQDVLTLAQGFVDVALHPLVKAVLNQYIGSAYSLCEAKGWQSLPTKHDFHGWHSDAWYDQTKVADRIPREVKLAFYLSDVQSGAFQYIKKSHQQRAPFHLQRSDVAALPLADMAEFLGPAGSAVLFDTSGIHRQGIPILAPRQAVFLNYHDLSVPLQQEDVEYYRYHPLLLNAALLGNLTAADTRILGFGDRAHYQPGFVRKNSHPLFQRCSTRIYGVKIATENWSGRVLGKLGRWLRR